MYRLERYHIDVSELSPKEFITSPEHLG